MSLLEQVKKWDADMLLGLNGAHTPFMDHTMYIYTRKETWVFFYLVLLILLIRQYGKRVWLLVPIIALTITCTDQMCNLFKYGFARPRPGHDPIIGELVHIFYKKGGRYGFVSAHSANAFALTMLLSKLIKNRWFTGSMAIWAINVAISRVYLGVHYPGDITGGMVLGLLIGWAMYKLATYLEPRVYKIGETTYDTHRVTNDGLYGYFVALGLMIIIPLLINWMYISRGYIN